jgi:YD repeat-containing protein
MIAYPNLGKRVQMTDGSGSTTWTYDARGRVLSETKIIDGQSFTTGYAYNSANLPTSMTYPGGEMVNFGYIPNMLSVDTVGS